MFAEGALVDATSADFDLAIDYGQILYSIHHAERLIEERLLPVMSPVYLESMPDLNWEQVNVSKTG